MNRRVGPGELRKAREVCVHRADTNAVLNRESGQMGIGYAIPAQISIDNEPTKNLRMSLAW